MGKIRICNKKKFVMAISSCIILLVLIVTGILLLISNFKGGAQKNKLETYLEEMGIDFYENYYYDKIGSNEKERKEFLANFKDIGIKVNLDTLSKYDGNKNADKVSKFVNKKTNQKCDYAATKVIFYPKEPYKVNSYTIETNIECK